MTVKRRDLRWIFFETECFPCFADSHFFVSILYSGSEFQVDLLESGAHCNVYAAAVTTKNQRQDIHSTIRHKAHGTTCVQEQRNIVADKADCVFKGRIVIDVSGSPVCFVRPLVLQTLKRPEIDVLSLSQRICLELVKRGGN